MRRREEGEGRRTMDRNRREEEEMKGRKNRRREEYSIRYNSNTII